MVTAGSSWENKGMQYRKLRIDYVDDCGPNEGGYFCQVYRCLLYTSRGV